MKNREARPISSEFSREQVRALAYTGAGLVIVFFIVGGRLLHYAVQQGLSAADQAIEAGLAPPEFLESVTKSQSLVGPTIVATAGFAAAVGVGFWLLSRRLQRWFEQFVSAPLSAMIDTAHNKPLGLADEVRSPSEAAPSTTFAEFGELMRHLVENQAHLRRVEREAQRQIREQEIGFGRVLRRAEDRATTDSLTGLRNRTFLAAELESIIENQRKRDEDLAVVMIDVDNFKIHNDTLGHKAGDDLLRFTGELLRGSLRPSDHAMRYAGDEFVLLLLGVGQQQAAAIMQRIVKLFAQYAATLGTEVPPSLSAGIATLKESPQDNGHALIVKADQALYAAKRRGKNAVATCAAA